MRNYVLIISLISKLASLITSQWGGEGGGARSGGVMIEAAVIKNQ
jgi:hypothetical protein